MGLVFQTLVWLPRRVKTGLLVINDMHAAFWASGAALLSHLAATPPGDITPDAGHMVILALVATPLSMMATSIYSTMLRFATDRLLLRALIAAALTTVAIYALGHFSLFLSLTGVGLLTFAAVLFLGVVLPRLILVEMYRYERSRRRRQRVFIYGAGDAGAAMAAAMMQSSSHRPLAFLDDDRQRQKRRIHGLRVYAPKHLPKLVQRLSPDVVLIAAPSASLTRRREIVRLLEPYPVRVQSLPPLAHILDRDHVGLKDVRDVSPEELLWRDAVAPVPDLLRHDITGRTILVTGGGGSIGSEICRQALSLGATKIIIIDHSEFALYAIDHELAALCQTQRKAGAPVADIVAVLGSVGDQAMVREVLRTHGVQTIYHAAAYKHVHIVEHNLLAGVMTNVIGTWRLAQAAIDCDVEKMVLISTDKAVRPTNLMGASKRLAEQALQALSGAGASCRFTMVRFGNVLDSNGSVVPLFRRQIADGGPVTLTHPDITRYFMTIPEAVQLVLQAGAMAEGGEVFLLDMGEPVKIIDLANRLIHLHGLTVRDEANPDGDIAIEIIGLRPGEKLYEELLIGANSAPSSHPSVMRAVEDSLTLDEMRRVVADLEDCVHERRVDAALDIVRRAVPEYAPQPIAPQPTAPPPTAAPVKAAKAAD